MIDALREINGGGPLFCTVCRMWVPRGLTPFSRAAMNADAAERERMYAELMEQVRLRPLLGAIDLVNERFGP